MFYISVCTTPVVRTAAGIINTVQHRYRQDTKRGRGSDMSGGSYIYILLLLRTTYAREQITIIM